MHEANELEVAGLWKSHGVGLPVHQFGGGQARGAIEARAIWRRPWAAPYGDTCASRSDLGECYLVVRRSQYGKGPRDTVANVNPQPIGQKRQSLYPLVSTFGARSGLPICSVYCPRRDE